MEEEVDPYDREVLALVDVLGRAVGASKKTRQAIERELGWASSSLSKLLAGKIDLKVRHVLQLADALGFDPLDLFEAAFATRRSRGRAGAAAPEETAPPQPGADEELEAQIRRILLRMIGAPARPSGGERES